MQTADVHSTGSVGPSGQRSVAWMGQLLLLRNLHPGVPGCALARLPAGSSVATAEIRDRRAGVCQYPDSYLEQELGLLNLLDFRVVTRGRSHEPCPKAGCGKPPVRFDEREVETEHGMRLLRHNRGNPETEYVEAYPTATSRLYPSSPVPTDCGRSSAREPGIRSREGPLRAAQERGQPALWTPARLPYRGCWFLAKWIH